MNGFSIALAMGSPQAGSKLKFDFQMTICSKRAIPKSNHTIYCFRSFLRFAAPWRQWQKMVKGKKIANPSLSLPLPFVRSFYPSIRPNCGSGFVQIGFQLTPFRFIIGRRRFEEEVMINCFRNHNSLLHISAYTVVTTKEKSTT